MNPLLAEVRSWTTATADLLLAAIGLGVLLYPGVATANAVLGEPVAPPTVRLTITVVAVGGTYPFIAGDWSLGRLRDTALAFLAGTLAVGLAVVAALGLELPGGDPRPGFAVVALAYLLAYLLVHRGWWNRSI
jgi:hypothetical protein